jgi:hypothetical protein
VESPLLVNPAVQQSLGLGERCDGSEGRKAVEVDSEGVDVWMNLLFERDERDVLCPNFQVAKCCHSVCCSVVDQLWYACTRFLQQAEGRALFVDRGGDDRCSDE